MWWTYGRYKLVVANPGCGPDMKNPRELYAGFHRMTIFMEISIFTFAKVIILTFLVLQGM